MMNRSLDPLVVGVDLEPDLLLETGGRITESLNYFQKQGLPPLPEEMSLRTSFSLQSPSCRRSPSIPHIRLAAVSSLSPFVPHVRLAAVSSLSLPVSPRRLGPLSFSTIASSASSSASASPPLTFRSRHNIQLPDELFKTDGSDGDDGSSGGGPVGYHDGGNNRKKVLMVLFGANWPPENLPVDLDGSAVSSSCELEKLPLLRMREGLMERLLADDLFFAKTAKECGAGIFTKIAAEYEQNFFKGLEIVFANVAMAVMADFVSVHLPMHTASLAPALANIAGPIAQFFYGCPDSAFQIALPGASYSVVQRLGAIASNGAKLFVVGTASSMVRTTLRNALIDARKVVEKSSGGEVEKVPVLSTALAYGVYMAIWSQVLDGVIDQRILEPLLHQHKLMLSATRFAVQTGNSILGSLLWIDYARLTGIQ